MSQIELFDVETEKKESIPNLRMRDFLRSEVRGTPTHSSHLTHAHTHTGTGSGLSGPVVGL